MNYKRRLLALGLIASMSLTGFRFSDDNLNQFMENMEQVSSAQGELNFQTDFRIQENGSWTEADVNVQGDWALISEPFALHVEAEVSSAAAGEVSELELYCKQRGDDLDVYFGVDGDWKYTETDYERSCRKNCRKTEIWAKYILSLRKIPKCMSQEKHMYMTLLFPAMNC